jgi:hypothetical protein
MSGAVPFFRDLVADRVRLALPRYFTGKGSSGRQVQFRDFGGFLEKKRI